MRKEILFAIISGSLLGLVIAFGIWRANLALKPKEELKTSQTPTPTAPEFSLTIAKPDNREVITISPAVLSGITKPETTVVVSGEKSDYKIEADNEGLFELEIDLLAGVNEIKISAFDEKGPLAEKTILIVYSTKFAVSSEEESPEQETATGPSELISERVQEKVEQARKLARAYIGTVTEISESTIQINKFTLDEEKIDKGEIQQISIDEEETTFLKITETSKEIEFSDVAIGDFIIAMGFKNENDVLEGKRALIVTPIKPSNRQAIYGRITELSIKELKVKQLQNDEEWLLEFGKKWVGPELDELNEEDKIICVGLSDDKTLEVRTIFLLTSSQASPTPEPEI